MRIDKTQLPEVKVISYDLKRDNRGYSHPVFIRSALWRTASILITARNGFITPPRPERFTEFIFKMRPPRRQS